MKMKPSVLAGWVLFLVFLFLTVFNIVTGLLAIDTNGMVTHIMLGLLQVAAFGIPTLFLTRYRSLQGQVQMRAGRLRAHFIPFVVCSAITISCASFLLSMLSAIPADKPAQPLQSYYPIGTGILSADMLLSLVTVALIPAVVEELFFRGAMFSLFERRGTSCALLVTSLAFSMMHGSPESLLPTFFAGLGYAFLACVTGSVWSSVIAHLLNNLTSIAVATLALNHSFNDYWRYFTALSLIFMFLFAYLALRSLRALTADGMTCESAPPASGNRRSALAGAVNTPGFLLFAACFVLRLAITYLFFP